MFEETGETGLRAEGNTLKSTNLSMQPIFDGKPMTPVAVRFHNKELPRATMGTQTKRVLSTGIFIKREQESEVFCMARKGVL